MGAAALNVIDTATALVIAQLPIAEKENEITAIPKLLKLLNIQESLVTNDDTDNRGILRIFSKKKGNCLEMV